MLSKQNVGISKHGLLAAACLFILAFLSAGCGTGTTTPVICAISGATTATGQTVFTQYIDGSGVFSISYPRDLWLNTSGRSYVADLMDHIKAGGTDYQGEAVFSAYTADVPGPNIMIYAEPAPVNQGYYTAMNSFILGFLQKAGGVSDYRQYAANDTYICGRQATVIEYGADLTDTSTNTKGSVHCMALFTIVNNNVWFVNCVSGDSEFSRWSVDFDSTVRSFNVNV